MKKSIRDAVYNKFGGRCAYCGVEIDVVNMQVDHIRPRRGYPEESENVDNMNPACPVCNNWKHSDNIESFRKSLQSQVRKCRDYSRNFRMAERYSLVVETYKPIVFYFEAIKKCTNT